MRRIHTEILHAIMLLNMEMGKFLNIYSDTILSFTWKISKEKLRLMLLKIQKSLIYLVDMSIRSKWKCPTTQKEKHWKADQNSMILKTVLKPNSFQKNRSKRFEEILHHLRKILWKRQSRIQVKIKVEI